MSRRVDGFKKEILNLPNMITIGRLFLIPPVILLTDKTDPLKSFLAMCLFLLAGLLDIVDGWLARRRGLVTFFGKFMDPLADKIMVMALLVYLVVDARLQAWVVVVLLGREFYISGLRFLAFSEGVEIVAGAGGKAKTSFQLIGICMILVYYTYRVPIWGGWVDFHKMGSVLVYVSIGLSIFSALDYTRGFIAELEKKGDSERERGTDETSSEDSDEGGPDSSA